jgi:hypothetical protein
MVMAEKIKIRGLCHMLFCLVWITGSADAWEFNADGDVEGWRGIQISDLQQATATGSGEEGVLRAVRIIGKNPNLTMPGVALADGECWARIDFRMRQMDGRGAPKAFNNTKTWLQFNNSTQCLLADWQTKTYDNVNDEGGAIAGDYANDSFVMTVTEQENHWMLISIDLTGAGYFQTNDIVQIKMWPIRNEVAANFEIDYFRIHSEKSDCGGE